MDVFGSDALIGNYRLSDHGLMLATFNYQDSYGLGFGMDVNKEYVGRNAKPRYYGSKPNSVLELTLTIIQNECMTRKSYFTEQECREILGRLTGFQGYKRMYVSKQNFMENLYYNVHVTDAEFEKSGDFVVGIILTMECDSPFAWVDVEYEFETNSNNQTIHVMNNSDLFYDYVNPVMIIKSDSDIDGLEIKNVTDNNRNTIIDHVNADEIITIDSNYDKITSTLGTNFSEIFNYKFPKLAHGYNEIVISHPMRVIYKMVLPRKVGVM